jgi:hypothetical protein
MALMKTGPNLPAASAWLWFTQFMPRRPVHSWLHILTDWCVIRAFERAGCPGCLRKPPALAAAFVAEVSKAVRFRTVSIREAELPVLLEAAAESACELAGGDAYRAVRDAAKNAEHEYHQSITRTGHCPQRYARHELCSTAVATKRQQFQAEINSAQRRIVPRLLGRAAPALAPVQSLRPPQPRTPDSADCYLHARLVGIVPPLAAFGISPARSCPISPARRPAATPPADPTQEGACRLGRGMAPESRRRTWPAGPTPLPCPRPSRADSRPRDRRLVQYPRSRLHFRFHRR